MATIPALGTCHGQYYLPRFTIMRNALILLVIIIAGGGWVANKYYQKTNKSSDEKTRFIELAESSNNNASLFITEHVEKYHEEAFESSYRMWVLSPISELNLETHYDQETYYRTMAKKIWADAKQAGQPDVYDILVDMAPNYGVELNIKKPEAVAAPAKTTPGSQQEREPLLKSGKLGDKRVIPSSRKRDNDYR